MVHAQVLGITEKNTLPKSGYLVFMVTTNENCLHNGVACTN